MTSSAVNTCTAIDNEDLLLCYDTANSELKQIKWSNFRKVSEFRAEGFAGIASAGSGTKTSIPYFNSVTRDTDQHGAISYVNNTTDGLVVTINTEGVYFVSYVTNNKAPPLYFQSHHAIQ